MEGLELTAFSIIASVGTARSCYIEVIRAAKEGQCDAVEELIAKGDEAFVEGHGAHAELLRKECAGEGTQITLLILHAEDQLMSAEAFKTIALEFIDTYRRIAALERGSRNACGGA